MRAADAVDYAVEQYYNCGRVYVLYTVSLTLLFDVFYIAVYELTTVISFSCCIVYVIGP